jgi:type II secretion system protein G
MLNNYQRGKPVNTHQRGFTLIELLIVVAIIGILAAIAVPNFMNAQLRAKVARVVSDMKAVAMAQEQYRLDRNQYTYDGDCGVGGAEHLSYIPLTTPISYINHIPEDAFAGATTEFQNRQTIQTGLTPVYEYTSRISFGPNGTQHCRNQLGTYNMLGRHNIEYIMTSLGPNQQQNYPWGEGGAQGLASRSAGFIYHPSNGLVSSGNIFVLNSQLIGGGI